MFLCADESALGFEQKRGGKKIFTLKNFYVIIYSLNERDWYSAYLIQRGEGVTTLC